MSLTWDSLGCPVVHETRTYNSVVRQHGYHPTCFKLDIVGRVSNGESIPFRPPLPENESNKMDFRLIGLMKEAWHEDPNSRPEIASVKAKLSVVNKGK